jgi:hypothetical protein
MILCLRFWPLCIPLLIRYLFKPFTAMLDAFPLFPSSLWDLTRSIFGAWPTCHIWANRTMIGKVRQGDSNRAGQNLHVAPQWNRQWYSAAVGKYCCALNRSRFCLIDKTKGQLSDFLLCRLPWTAMNHAFDSWGSVSIRLFWLFLSGLLTLKISLLMNQFRKIQLTNS